MSPRRSPFKRAAGEEILGLKCRFNGFFVVFESVSHGSSSVEYRGKLTPVFGITDVLPYGIFTGVLPGVRGV